ncbi:MAG: succinate dehydrogenase cytochrome b subunit [Actinomycetaceae bacterium]|nr:succinate dehydrogenase cytochrome b subunit [Actinomycetaceae bacterium]
MATTQVATKKRRAWTTTVFVKQLMAISGLFFVLFLLFHSYGNLKAFIGKEAYDSYAHWLHHDALYPIFPHGAFIWVFRGAMMLMFVVHVAAAAETWKRSRRARRSSYVVKKNAADAYAARTMRVTAVLLLGLIIFHILHFTTATVQTGFTPENTPYERMVHSFQNPLMVIVYLVFVGAACLHVAHGFWSAFQSLGWVRAATRQPLVIVSGLIGVLIFVMFMAPPLAIAFGFIH